jgi:fused signal recognition particle receptor
VKQRTGADPAAVVFDALAAAQARGADVVLIDTAGRLHTKVNLMEELKKVKRVIERQLPGAPHEVLLILDATTGQNAVAQTRLFHQELGVTGLVLTKLDGTAKGGIVVGICQEFQIPLRFIGLGEGLDDLREFDADQFVEALF